MQPLPPLPSHNNPTSPTADRFISSSQGKRSGVSPGTAGTGGKLCMPTAPWLKLPGVPSRGGFLSSPAAELMQCHLVAFRDGSDYGKGQPETSADVEMELVMLQWCWALGSDSERCQAEPGVGKQQERPELRHQPVEAADF